jgi:hypothetical protein
MAVVVEMQDTGSTEVAANVTAMVEHVLAERPGYWRVSIIGSQERDTWELKIFGPQGFERSYTLEGSAGEHRPEVIAYILRRMVLGGRNFLSRAR